MGLLDTVKKKLDPKKNAKKEPEKKGMEKYGFKPLKWEIARTAPFVETPFPQSARTYRFVNQSFTLSTEETYFWLLNHLQTDWGFYKAYKITDLFAAGEASSVWGTVAQRLSFQQEKASNYIALIGKMTKELFMIVRELRIIEERLTYYEESNKGYLPAEIALKGIWIDMVEGASKNPASVYGLSRELGFTILPDLFFATFPKKTSEIDSVVDKLEFNNKLKEVLKRKLYSFMTWKVETHKELQSRKTFQLKYLRQFYNTIKLYMSWIKPYLRNARRLSGAQHITESQHIIAAFETTGIEVETLFIQPQKPPYNSCVLLSLRFTTQPSLGYQQAESYQRGPIHIGRVEAWLHAYAWTEEEIKKYLAYKEDEEINLMKSISESVEAAMDALGDDLRKYLEESGEELEKKPDLTQKIKPPSALDPFISIFKGFGDIVGAFGVKLPEKQKGPSKFELDNAKAAAEKTAVRTCWNVYKNYKKAHKMIAW